MDKESFIDFLKSLAMTLNESRCYLSLLERNVLTVSEVASFSGISRANAYNALEKLMSKGLCISKAGDTKKYSASDPSILEQEFHSILDSKMNNEVSSLKKKEKELLEKTQTEKKNISEMLKELRLQYESSQQETAPMDYIEIIKNMRLAARKFLEISGRVEFEALHFVKGPFTGDRAALQKQVDMQCERAKGKHVRARVLYEIKDKDDEWIYEFIEAAAKGGDEDARIVKHLPLKGAVIDERIIIISMHDPIKSKTSFTTLIIEHPDLASTLKITFETLWKKAIDYRKWKPGK